MRDLEPDPAISARDERDLLLRHFGFSGEEIAVSTKQTAI